MPIGIVTLVLARGCARAATRTRARSTYPGQVALIGGLFLLVFALLRGNEDGWDSAKVVASLVGAGVFLVGFVVIEHSREPMLPLTLFRQPQFTGPQVLVFGIAATFFAGFLYATLYLQGVVGLSPIRTGLAYLPGNLPGVRGLRRDRRADDQDRAGRAGDDRAGVHLRRDARDGRDDGGGLRRGRRSCPDC